jgi:hypothetical protein
MGADVAGAAGHQDGLVHGSADPFWKKASTREVTLEGGAPPGTSPAVKSPALKRAMALNSLENTRSPVGRLLPSVHTHGGKRNFEANQLGVQTQTAGHQAGHSRDGQNRRALSRCDRQD